MFSTWDMKYFGNNIEDGFLFSDIYISMYMMHFYHTLITLVYPLPLSLDPFFSTSHTSILSSF